jgi:hypothetical protein
MSDYIFTTHVCEFPQLQPSIHDYINPVIRTDDPILYCVEAIEQKSGEPIKYYAYILTKTSLIWASDNPTGSMLKYVDIEKITVKQTRNGYLYYVNVEYNALVQSARIWGDSDKFHFETEDKAHAFANLIKKFGNIR